MAEILNKVGGRSIKHDIISKTNTNMLITVSVAVFVVIFCLVASKALLSQSFYQNKVISEKKSTLKILTANKVAASTLEGSYQTFASAPVNVLGGSPAGVGPKDGDNAKLVLDSLPSVLDFPGLSSSLEKILLDGGYIIQSIGGQETPTGIDLTTATTTPTVAPSPTEVEYPLGVSTSPEASLALLQILEKSIRPFNITALKIEGAGNNIDLDIRMKTYYQSPTGLQVSSKVVK